MWLRFGVTVLFILAIAAAVWDIVPWFEIQRWAVGGTTHVPERDGWCA